MTVGTVTWFFAFGSFFALLHMSLADNVVRRRHQSYLNMYTCELMNKKTVRSNTPTHRVLIKSCFTRFQISNFSFWVVPVFHFLLPAFVIYFICYRCRCARFPILSICHSVLLLLLQLPSFALKAVRTEFVELVKSSKGTTMLKLWRWLAKRQKYKSIALFSSVCESSNPENSFKSHNTFWFCAV